MDFIQTKARKIDTLVEEICCFIEDDLRKNETFTLHCHSIDPYILVKIIKVMKNYDYFVYYDYYDDEFFHYTSDLDCVRTCDTVSFNVYTNTLSYACKYGYTKSVFYHLSKGVKPNKNDTFYAKLNQYDDIVSLLTIFGYKDQLKLELKEKVCKLNFKLLMNELKFIPGNQGYNEALGSFENELK